MNKNKFRLSVLAFVFCGVMAIAELPNALNLYYDGDWMRAFFRLILSLLGIYFLVRARAFLFPRFVLMLITLGIFGLATIVGAVLSKAHVDIISLGVEYRMGEIIVPHFYTGWGTTPLPFYLLLFSGVLLAIVKDLYYGYPVEGE